MTRHPVWDLLDKLQMDVGAMDKKLVELRANVAALDIEALSGPAWAACPECGLHKAHLAGCSHAPAPLPDLAATAFAEARANNLAQAARLARSVGERATDIDFSPDVTDVDVDEYDVATGKPFPVSPGRNLDDTA